MLSDRAIARALADTGGVELAAARLLSWRLGREITREKVVERIRSSPMLQEAAQDAEEEILDIVQGHLHQLVYRGSFLEITFLLSTAGASRGYGRQPENEAPMSNDAKAFRPLSEEELDARRKRVRERIVALHREHGLKPPSWPD